jgi:alginate O-acetyltransferase complex protein AlgF
MAVRQRHAGWLSVFFLGCAGPAHAESALYETGPAQDASFVRFLNATDGDIAVVAARGGYRIALGRAGEARVSKFHPAVAGATLRASVEAGGRKLPVEVVARPGEYVTVAVLAGKGGPSARLIREIPGDYNASRASLALANADGDCAPASLSGGASNVAILEGVEPFAIRRRLVNPVRVTVQAACGGKATRAPLDLGQLEPGERYTAFVIPLAGVATAFAVRDVQ